MYAYCRSRTLTDSTFHIDDWFAINPLTTGNGINPAYGSVRGFDGFTNKIYDVFHHHNRLDANLITEIKTCQLQKS